MEPIKTSYFRTDTTTTMSFPHRLEIRTDFNPSCRGHMYSRRRGNDDIKEEDIVSLYGLS